MYVNLWLHTSIIYINNIHHSFSLRCALMMGLVSATSVIMASFCRLGGVVFIDSFFGIRGKALAKQLPPLWLVPWKPPSCAL